MMMQPPPMPGPTGSPPAPAGGAGPSPMGVPALAPLAQRSANGAQGMIPQQLQAMMLFLAGMGLPELARSLDRMKPKEPGHKGQLAKEATANPGMTNSLQAQMIAKLAAARGAGGAPGGVQGAIPGAAPAANPMAMFMGR